MNNKDVSIFGTEENFDEKEIELNQNVSLEKQTVKNSPNENPIKQFEQVSYSINPTYVESKIELASEDNKIKRGALESSIPSISTGVVEAMDYDYVKNQIEEYKETKEEPVKEIKEIKLKQPAPIDYRLEALERNYYQDNYEKLRKNVFNIPACLFGGIYFYYRKMYFIGFLAFAITFILISLTKNIIPIIILEIIYGFIFNPLYKYIARIDIKLIKEDNNNTNLELECTKKGGTIKEISAIIISILTIAVFFALTVALFNKDIIKNIFGEKKDEEKETMELTANNFLSSIQNYIAKTDTYETYDILFPQATNGKNVSCTLKDGSDIWQITNGYKFTKTSSTCKEFMKKVYETEPILTYPTNAILTFDSAGNLQDASKLNYEEYNCTYNISIESFECLKK